MMFFARRCLSERHLCHLGQSRYPARLLPTTLSCRSFTIATPEISAAAPVIPKSELEGRINAIPQSRIRNFCIVAHVDHGKSTLSDRLLELTGTVAASAGRDVPQLLDRLAVEKARGITVKAQTAAMIFMNPKDGLDYLFHLVDTPGHVDFRDEVARSYAACEGALLLVDASQGVQAQTVANFYLAFAKGLSLVPVVNKIDLPSADPAAALAQMEDHFELPASSGLGVSAKTGAGVGPVLSAVVDKIPAPSGKEASEAPLRMLLVDSWYDNYKGVILLVRLFDGELSAGNSVRSLATGIVYTVGEVGVMFPDPTPQSRIRAGQVGYLFFAPGMKNLSDAKPGDTYTVAGPAGANVEPLPGFADPKSMVFVSAFPASTVEHEHVADSIARLSLNDRSISVRPEVSAALGPGWRLGFLGMLHCSVFEDRLRQEHGAQVVLTAPAVPYRIRNRDGTDDDRVAASDFPTGIVSGLLEPIVPATMTVPTRYLGRVLELCEASRGEQTSMTQLSAAHVVVEYSLPLGRLADDFFGKLKAASQGYATLDYGEAAAFRPARLCRLDLLVNREPVDAISRIVHASEAVALGRSWVRAFRDIVPRGMIEIVIQARVTYPNTSGAGHGNTVVEARPHGQSSPAGIIARETIKPFRKDVLAKLHASDISRRKKLLEKQKEGKKRMQSAAIGTGAGAIDRKALQKFLSRGSGSG